MFSDLDKVDVDEAAQRYDEYRRIFMRYNVGSSRENYAAFYTTIMLSEKIDILSEKIMILTDAIEQKQCR